MRGRFVSIRSRVMFFYSWLQVMERLTQKQRNSEKMKILQRVLDIKEAMSRVRVLKCVNVHACHRVLLSNT